MTINPVRMAGAVCAALTALLLVSISAPATAQSRSSAPVALTSAAKAKTSPAATQRAHKPNRMPHWDTYTTGNPDLAFMSAGQYVELSAYDGAVFMVSENEFSPLDFAAGNVRVVDPDELTEIDLANDPEVMLAQARPIEPIQPAEQVTAAAEPEPAAKGEEDDGILNRVLMTFAGALALAGAMKVLFA